MTAPERPGLRRRIAGLTYEGLLVLGVLSVTFMVPHLVIGLAFGATAPGWVLLLHVFLVLGGYFLWYWDHGGQTLAMQTWKMQVVRSDNGKPSRMQLVLRYFLAWPSLLCYGVGIVWAVFDRDRQFLHDRLAGTKIIFKAPAALP